MLPEILLSIAIALSPVTLPATMGASNVVLASHSISMSDRYSNEFVNTIFKDNILLTMQYMDGAVKSKNDINWDNIEKPFTYQFKLKPGERFVFDDAVMPKYKDNIIQSTNANFGWDEGFKSDGFLIGDGVCHLASMINWAAKDAGLDSYAPSNHDFAKIPDVPKEYGTAIQYPSPMGNLYITNNQDKPVTFSFDFDGNNLKLSISESN